VILAQAFNVATEFRFEIGSALLNTNKLKDSVEGLSQAVDDTLVTFQKLGTAFTLSLGSGGGGFLGAMSTAIQSFDKFKQSQLDWINLLEANKNKLEGPIKTWGEQALFAEKVMLRIADISKRFSLPEKDFNYVAKQLAAPMLTAGLTGRNMEETLGVARGFMKSAPILGVDPGLAMGQLVDLMGGKGVKARLWERLSTETDTLRPFMGKLKEFNKLLPTKRVALLNRAMGEFSNNTKVFEERAKTISGMMTKLSNVFNGFNSILMPLGKLLQPLVVDAMQRLHGYLDGPIRNVVNNLVKIVKPYLGSLEDAVLNVMALRSLSDDLKSTATGASVMGISMILGSVATFITGIAFFGSFWVPVLAGALYVVYDLIKRIAGESTKVAGIFAALAFGGAIAGILAFFGKLSVILVPLGVFAAKVIAPLVILFGVFRLFSKAVSIARIQDMKTYPQLISRMSDELARTKSIWDGLTASFADDSWAQSLSAVFRKSFWYSLAIDSLEVLNDLFHRLASGLVIMKNVFTALLYAVVQYIGDLLSLNIAGSIDRFKQNYIDVLTQGMERDDPSLKDIYTTDKPVVSQVTNIAKVEMRNNFRENMHPDRIAFTIVDQLGKAGRNKTRATGGTLSAAAVGGVQG